MRESGSMMFQNQEGFREWVFSRVEATERSERIQRVRLKTISCFSNSLSKLRSGGKYRCCDIKKARALKLQPFPEKVATFIHFQPVLMESSNFPFSQVSRTLCPAITSAS